MDLFEFLILLNLFSSKRGSLGCSYLIITIFILCCCGFVFQHYKFFLIYFVFCVLVIFIYLFIVYGKNTKKYPTKDKQVMLSTQEISILEGEIGILAREFLDKEIFAKHKDIEKEDYEKFSDIVQNEHKITVKNPHNQQVPYIIKRILYTEFIKRKNGD